MSSVLERKKEEKKVTQWDLWPGMGEGYKIKYNFQWINDWIVVAIEVF